MVSVYGTLGPACSDYKTLLGMFKAGMTGLRVNLSHVTLVNAANDLKTVIKAAEDCGISPKILIDLQGPELRIMNSAEVRLEPGNIVTLGRNGLNVPSILFNRLKKDQTILLDDGKISLVVKKSFYDQIEAEVVRGGLLRPRKSIAVPGCQLDTPALTETDIDNLSHALEFGVTGVMQPFVRNKRDLLTVRNEMYRLGCGSLRLFAKIENLQGVEFLDEIIEGCDEIVIARGDLGNSVELWELPGLQKQISEKCRKKSKDFMVVTQMLSSMETNPIPTRAEVSDIFNAVIDGASSVMVTGETAMGKYPENVIRYLVNTSRCAENYQM